MLVTVICHFRAPNDLLRGLERHIWNLPFRIELESNWLYITREWTAMCPACVLRLGIKAFYHGFSSVASTPYTWSQKKIITLSLYRMWWVQHDATAMAKWICRLLSQSSLEPLISLDLVGKKLYCFRTFSARLHCLNSQSWEHCRHSRPHSPFLIS